MAGSDLTAQRLRELLHYDPETGVFTWSVRTSNRIKVGDVAGSGASRGCLQIAVEGRLYLAHRLAWLYVYGCWPVHAIDHRDGNPSNNRIENLRDVLPSVNSQNMRRSHRDNKTGLLGVAWDNRRGKWIARITASGKRMHLGYFDSAENASVAYLRAKEIHHPGSEITTHRNALPEEIYQPGTKAKSGSFSGLRGVLWSKRLERWHARISINGEVRHLGSFDTAEDAHKAYLVAKRTLQAT
jgi:hypothetical protein